MALAIPTLRQRAIACLARREYSRAELARKLEEHSPSKGDLEALLDALEREKLLSDERYAQSVVHRRSAGRGVRLVSAELRRQGVPDELVREQARAMKSTELERARDAWRKKFGVVASDPRERARQMRFLSARGFDADVVRRVVGADEE